MIRGNVNNINEIDNKDIIRGLNWIKNNSILSPGQYEIEGRKIFAIVQVYNTKEESELKWEGHRKYIDIQYIQSGEESIAVASIKESKNISEYDADSDVQFFNSNGIVEQLVIDDYLILYPEDIHMPGIGNGENVKKVVLKVALNNC